MTVSLVVAVTPDRIPAWEWLRGRYETTFPDWQIVQCDDRSGGPWSKGAAVNDAAHRAMGDVLVIADADMLASDQALHHALRYLENGAAWVVPYRSVYRLSEPVTRRVLAGEVAAIPTPLCPNLLERPVTRGPAGGGIVVVRAADFHKVGGIDPAFTGWGGEDEAFGRALDTLVGPHARLNYPAWHLWHPTLRPADGRASRENERLAGMYLDAVGDRDAMAVLCAREVAV
jgi:hypothetical protein